jgi:YD repeat-containing protein
VSRRCVVGVLFASFWLVLAVGAARASEAKLDEQQGAEVLRWQHDALGRLSRRVTSWGDKQSYAWNPQGHTVTNLAENTGGERRQQQVRYDDAGPLTGASGERGTQSRTYDAADNLTAEAARAKHTERQYRADRLLNDSHGNGYRYDPTGRLVAREGPDGTLRLWFDDRDRWQPRRCSAATGSDLTAAWRLPKLSDMHRLNPAVWAHMSAPYPTEAIWPLADALERFAVHDAELIGIRCDISWNADGFITLLLDPHWQSGPQMTDVERWPTMLIRLPGVLSIELEGHADFEGVRRNVVDAVLSEGTLCVSDTLGAQTVVSFSGVPSAVILSPDGALIDPAIGSASVP